MTAIVATIIHGSHLFGTSTEDSDRDYKSVVLPDARAILLGRVDESWQEQTKMDLRARNTSHDTDHEHHYLLRFVRMLASANQVAIEMLFAADRFHVRDVHPVWRVLQANSDRIVSRNYARFQGSCRDQAKAFELKAGRLETAEALERHLSALIERHGRQERLSAHIPAILDAFQDRECVTSELRTQRGSRKEQIVHISMFGKMAPETASLETAHQIVLGKIRDYGERTRRARDIGGKDWKDLSHAVRAGYEGIELLRTGRLQFPCHGAPRLLAIKKGLVPFEEVMDEVTFLVNEMPRVAATCGLPDEADLSFLEGIVADAHLDAILSVRPALEPT